MDAGDIIEIIADSVGAIIGESSSGKNVLIGLGLVAIFIGIVGLIIYLV